MRRVERARAKEIEHRYCKGYGDIYRIEDLIGNGPIWINVIEDNYEGENYRKQHLNLKVMIPNCCGSSRGSIIACTTNTKNRKKYFFTENRRNWKMASSSHTIVGSISSLLDMQVGSVESP